MPSKIIANVQMGFLCLLRRSGVWCFFRGGGGVCVFPHQIMILGPPYSNNGFGNGVVKNNEPQICRKKVKFD